MMEKVKDILRYYREELGWNPPFADCLGRYAPKGLAGYLEMRQAVNEGELEPKVRELLFAVLDAVDDEESGAKAHARAAVEAGLTVKELTEAFLIATLVKGINVLCKSGVAAILAAEERHWEMYRGIVVEESLDDNRLLNDVAVRKTRITEAARWHLHEVWISEEGMKMLASHLTGNWYMHFWKENPIGGPQVTVWFRDRRFSFDYEDKESWREFLAYGRSLGLPEEQLDIPIIGL